MIVPSYVAKVSRAKKHLIDLQAAIDSYAAGHPYTVADLIEGKRKVHRLRFTASPANTEISVIAADVIYNLRSALDHLMSSLVPSNQRNSAMFPIYFQGVWEPHIAGENPERVKTRDRWASDTKGLSEPVLAILKDLQPADGCWEQEGVDLLQWLGRLSNRDRHEKLPIIAFGLREPIAIRYTLRDGTKQKKWGTGQVAAFESDAKIEGLPEGAMDVEVEGTPVVSIRIRKPEGHFHLPDHLWDILGRVERGAIARLAPLVRT